VIVIVIVNASFVPLLLPTKTTSEESFATLSQPLFVKKYGRTQPSKRRSILVVAGHFVERQVWNINRLDSVLDIKKV
jgi:hypothetical protein